MIQIAGVLLKLPDGRVVFNRRGKTAPVSAGLLALYGGHIEEDELPVVAAARELSEETSIRFDAKELAPLSEFEVSSEGKPKKFHVFTLGIKSENFNVYEGDGSEVYTIKDALTRNDLTESCRKSLEEGLKKNGR